MRVSVMNGWKEAPHCWRHFLRRPIRIERTPAWISVSILGVVVFFG